MGVEEEVEKKFTKFVEFCTVVLGKDGEQIVVLIKKRYNECSSRFKQSPDMLKLIKSTKNSMKAEPKRNIIHLKDFLNELKAYKKKRKAKEEIGDRVSKLRKLDGNCSEASTDGTLSGTEELKSCTRSEDSNDSVCILDNNIINNTGDYKTDDIALPVINLKTKYISTTTDLSSSSLTGTASENNSIKKTDDLPSVGQHSADDDRDVVMIADDGDEGDVKVNGIKDESCVVIDDDSPVDSPANQKSLMSMLNLQRKPLINGSLDDDVIICDLIKPKQSITNLPITELPKLKLKSDKSSKLGAGSKSNKVKVDKASSSKSEESKDNDSDKKKVDKTEKHIKRLEALLEKLKTKIEELREQEMSLEDLDDDMSSYIYEDKLERKFVTVWNKLCQLKGRNKTTGRPAERVFNYSGTRYEEMNKKLERLVNKHKEFPDFHDVKNVIKKVNNKSSLGLSASQIDSIARESFLDVGNLLQERRHKDFMCTFKCRVQDNFSFEQDPALYDAELQRKLDDNRKQGKDKLEEVINKFADKQIYDDDGDEDQGGCEEGGEKKEKEGGETSQEEEEDDEEEEVVEDIEDVDQFVDDTEILASYTPSRPAISVNHKLTTFHAQVVGESGLDADKKGDNSEDRKLIGKGGMENEQIDDENGAVDQHMNGVVKDSSNSNSNKQNDSENGRKDSKSNKIDIVGENSDAEGPEAKEDQEVMTDSSAIEISEVEDMVTDDIQDTDDDDDIVIVSAESGEEIVENGGLVEIRPSKSIKSSSKELAENKSAESESSTLSENSKKINSNRLDRSPQDTENVQVKFKRIAPTPVSSSFMAEISNDDKVESTTGSDHIKKSADSDVCLINLNNEDDVPKSGKTNKMEIDKGEKDDCKIDTDLSENAGESETSDSILKEFIKSVSELDKLSNCDDGDVIKDKADDHCLDGFDQIENKKSSKEDSKDAVSSIIGITDDVGSTSQSKERNLNDDNPKKDLGSTVHSKVASPKQDEVPDAICIYDSEKDTIESPGTSLKHEDASEVIVITPPLEVETESKKTSPKKSIGIEMNDASNSSGAKNPPKEVDLKENASDVPNITDNVVDSTVLKEDLVDTTDRTESTISVNPKKDVVSNIISASHDSLKSVNSLNPDQDVPQGQTENKGGGTDLESYKSYSPISGSSNSQENKSINICDDNIQSNDMIDSSSNSEVKTVESLSKKNLPEKSDCPLADSSADDNPEVCDISDDSQSMTSDIPDNETEITEKRDDLESTSCDSQSQSSSARKPLLVSDFSEDSQSNDCQVIDGPDSECVLIDDDFECDSSIKLEKCSPKTLKLPEFLNTQNPLSIRNKMSNLFNKAKINVGKTSKTLNSKNENRANNSAFCMEQTSCSQVSTSSENFSRSPRKMSKHLPTTSLKKTTVQVDSFLIEIDEADLDSLPNSMEVDEDNICQSTTEEFERNEVSSSICEPDVIILSDSD